MKQKILILAALLLAFCMTGCDSVIMQLLEMPQNKKEEKLCVETIQSDTGDAVSLELTNGTGLCDVRCTTGSKADIRAECKIEAGSQKLLEDCAAHLKVYAAEEDDVFRVGMTEKESGADFWTWLQSKYGDSVSVTIDFYITLPESIQIFSIDNRVGAIEIRDADGVFTLHNRVGDIALKDSIVRDGSQLKTDVGSIDLSTKSIYGVTELSTANGNIRLTFEDECVADGSLSAVTDTGDILFFPNQNAYATLSDMQDGAGASVSVKLTDSYTLNMRAKTGAIRYSREDG